MDAADYSHFVSQPAKPTCVHVSKLSFLHDEVCFSVKTFNFFFPLFTFNHNYNYWGMCRTVALEYKVLLKKKEIITSFQKKGF